VTVDLTRYRPKRSMAAKVFDRSDLRGFLGLDSANRLYNWLAAGANTLGSGNRSDALEHPDVIYRGQPNADYGLSSSLYRHCKFQLKRVVREADLVKAETTIIETMRSEGLGRLMTDLELLQVLQHHGIPTRLVDVSTGPLEALFFAVDRDDAADGRLFILRLDARVAGDRLLRSAGTDLPWHDMARGATRARDRWTQTLALINADPLDPRMRAQRGKFLVGGLNRRSAGRNIQGVTKDDFADVSSLGVHFLKQLRTRANACWPATGWTIRIPSVWKAHLRRRLSEESEPVTPDSMYPPIGEVRRLALSRAQDALTNA
jgi:FRG domain